MSGNKSIFESTITCSALLAAFVSVALFNVATLSRLDWLGFSWLGHSDHWHIMEVAQSWRSGFSLLSLDLVYSRLPSLFPDAVLAVISYFGAGFSVTGMVVHLFLMFGLYLASSLILLHLLSVRITYSVFFWLLLALLLFVSLFPEAAWSFAPIHHGGNAINVILSLSLCVWFHRSRGDLSPVLSFFTISVASLAFCLSNRFFVVSFMLPFTAASFIAGRWNLRLLSSLWAGSIVGMILAGRVLMQGRDSLPSVDLNLLVPAFAYRVFYVPSLLIIVLALSCLFHASRSGEKAGIRISLPRLIDFTSSDRGLFYVFLLISIAFSLFVELFVTGFAYPGVQSRYILGSLMLLPLLFILFLSEIAPVLLVRSHSLLVSLAVLAVGLGYLFSVGQQDISTFVRAGDRNFAIAKVLDSTSLPSKYGLATYPYWQALAIKGFSSGEIDVMDASSDGTPMFWYRWKGALYTRPSDELAEVSGLSSRSYDPSSELYLGSSSSAKQSVLQLKPYSFVLVSPYHQERVVGHYGKPSRKVYCEAEGYDCLWIYDSNEKVLSDIDLFVRTYGDNVKS